MIKGLFERRGKKVTYTTLRQKIKDYNMKEHKKHIELVKKKSNLDKKHSKYF